MEANPVRARGTALEAACQRQVEALRLRSRRDEDDRGHRLRADLGAELDLRAGELLDRLIELGITPETAPAFEALPLLEVAWADGEVDEEEAWRVLALATSFGLELGRPAHAQIELWLSRRPEPALFDAWTRFAAERLSRPDAAGRARRVAAAALEVASAAGGVFGLGAVSRSERAALARIRKALGCDGEPHVART